MTRTKPTSVLFVCVHNAGRSQMAAGFLKEMSGRSVEVFSAGSMPGAQINPVAVEASSVVITMGCGDECPYFPGTRYEDWELTDPAGEGIEVVRAVRDEIKARVDALIVSLCPTSAGD